MKLGRLLARLVIGALFIGHGTQKWFGWFGGPGLEKTTGMMDSLGMRPGRRNALAASAAETIGGTMIALGALTPLAAASLIATMLTAIRTVHLEKGIWAANGGYEYNLTLIAALLVLVDGGPGSPSVDAALGIEDTGGSWVLAALAGGAAGAALAAAVADREAPVEMPESPSSESEGADLRAAA